jgi:hypothetical protein
LISPDSGTDALFVVRPSRLHLQAGRLHHKFANRPRRRIAVGDLEAQAQIECVSRDYVSLL